MLRWPDARKSICFAHRDFAGVHFTGSYRCIQQHVENDWQKHEKLSDLIPRIVGETGGKDFVIAHKSADPDVVATAIT